ncbi:hypothetical protein GCM10022403_074150 [Streptomyces coacervatus]|uniref:Uncharacterized protein n=1 Tax=Streptomyces coacervatus TaxID=647381 RepID=A0ABP7IYD3_9ACTN
MEFKAWACAAGPAEATAATGKTATTANAATRPLRSVRRIMGCPSEMTCGSRAVIQSARSVSGEVRKDAVPLVPGTNWDGIQAFTRPGTASFSPSGV